MQNLGLPVYTPETYKKNRVFRHSNGNFILVKCGSCGEQTICYSHSQSDMKCKGCAELILKSTGGAAELVNKARSKVAENIY